MVAPTGDAARGIITMRLTTVAIRLIRHVDRRGGLTTRRGEAAYARAAPWIAGPLHRRILRDTDRFVGRYEQGLMVDLGSGPGSLTVELGRHHPTMQIIGIEPNPRMLEMARGLASVPNVRFEPGSAEHVPLPDDSVDALVSALSVHHWLDLAGSLAEITRVLRPTGVARLYDVRFATATGEELRAAAARARLDGTTVERTVPSDQGALPLVALIEVRGPHAPLIPV